MDFKKNFVFTSIKFILLISGMLIVSACGSSDSNAPTTQTSSSPGYRVGQKATVDPQNYYPHLVDSDGVCLTPDNLSSSCKTNVGRQVTQLSAATGFIGYSYGLNGFNRSDLDLDPNEQERIPTYSGPTATYSAKHFPVAAEQGNYTYFVYSGPATLDNSSQVLSTDNNGRVTTFDNFLRTSDAKSNALAIYLARYNHKTKKVSAPLLVHVKNTDDPHDNAVLNFDSQGNLYILVSGRSLIRSALLYFIEAPNSQTRFDSNHLILKDISPENIDYTDLGASKITTPDFAGITYPKLLRINDGFRLIYTLYCLNGGNQSCHGTRQLWSAKLTFNSSTSDRALLEQVQPLAALGGHYAVASASEDGKNVAIAFNYLHEASTSNRTNLYVLLSRDGGENWSSISPFSFTESDLTADLPLSTPGELDQANVLNVFPGKGNVLHRIYVKDVSFKMVGGKLMPLVLFVGSSGRYSHNPTLQPIHYLGLAEFTEKGWFTRAISSDIDHNYSTGFLHVQNAQLVSSFFPAAPEENRNALAGGAFAKVKVGLEPNATEYLTVLDQTMTEGYLTGLCETNYLRRVVHSTEGNIIGIASASNPYKFESHSSNPDAPASPIYLIDEQENLYLLPMVIDSLDENGEASVTLVEKNKPLRCDSAVGE